MIGNRNTSPGQTAPNATAPRRNNNNNSKGFTLLHPVSSSMAAIIDDDTSSSGASASAAAKNHNNKKKKFSEERKRAPKGWRNRTWLRRENLLVLATISAVLVGTLLGISIRMAMGDGGTSERAIVLISFPGEIFMHMLKMIVIPLIVSSLIAGLARLDARQSGRIGSITVAYYLSTTVVAVATGVILVLIIRPGQLSAPPNTSTMHQGTAAGRRNATTGSAALEKRADTLDAMLDLMRNAFPENILQSTLQHQQTVYEPTKSTMTRTIRNGGARVQKVETIYKHNVVYKDGMNIIGLIVFSIGFGIVLGQMGEAALPLVNFFSVFEQVIMRLVSTIMWFSPIGIASLIAGKILQLENVGGTLQSLALFTGTVIGGQTFHLLVSLPLIFFLLTRQNPYRFMRGLIQAWTTALGTASSAATLPVTYACMEKNLGIDKRVTRFVLPIGATINMDGTALYEAVAAIFIAEMNGMNLSFGQVITVSLTATLASIGAASIPHGGFVMLVLVLAAIGLPAKDVSLVVAVDWFIDRFRTAVNVLGDALGAGIVHHFTKDQLAMDSTPSTLDDYDQEERAPIISGDTNLNTELYYFCC